MIESVRRKRPVWTAVMIPPSSGKRSSSRSFAVFSRPGRRLFRYRSTSPKISSGQIHQTDCMKLPTPSIVRVRNGISRPSSSKIFAKRGMNTVKSSTITSSVTETTIDG